MPDPVLVESPLELQATWMIPGETDRKVAKLFKFLAK
jgi:type III secretion system FlhB-like substrate exporter